MTSHWLPPWYGANAKLHHDMASHWLPCWYGAKLDDDMAFHWLPPWHGAKLHHEKEFHTPFGVWTKSMNWCILHQFMEQRCAVPCWQPKWYRVNYFMVQRSKTFYHSVHCSYIIRNDSTYAQNRQNLKSRTFQESQLKSSCPMGFHHSNLTNERTYTYISLNHNTNFSIYFPYHNNPKNWFPYHFLQQV